MEYTWNGKWICADMTVEERLAPVFKKNFSIDKNVKSVTVYICGLGLFEMKVNGCLPDDSVLNPAHTQYSSTVLYRVFDVTELIKNGKNTLTVELGNSFFNENSGVWNWQNASWRSAPKLIADIVVNYTDGTNEIISTDTSWLVTKDGPTVANSIYLGEIFDARKTEDTFNWCSAICTEAPKGKLKIQDMPPIKRISTMKPLKIEAVGNGYVVTAPEMTTGWIALNINEPKDSCVAITYGERLNEKGLVIKIGKGEGRDGTWWPEGYIQHDEFISNGVPCIFEPKFSYKGFKYIHIENYSGELTADDITIYRVANDVNIHSQFDCSDELVNSLHALARRTVINNFQGKPTDTPVWEKNGWLGDASCGLETMMYNFDMSTFLPQLADTMADCFNEYGTVPIMVPAADWGTDNSPVWNTVFVFAVKALCDYCGKTDYAEKLYPLLREFALKDIEQLRNNGWVWDTNGLADWVSPSGEEDTACGCMASEGAEICGTAYIYKMLTDMCTLAKITDNQTDCDEYLLAAENICNAFNDKFYNKAKGIYETSFWKQEAKRDKEYRQTSHVVPLAFGMVPENNRKAVAQKLNADIVKRDYHLDTGCIGTKYILPVLIDYGYADTAVKVLTQNTYPSWGFWIKNGSDSAWESWEKDTRSKNHYFLATYDEALYSHFAGIRDIQNGYEHFTVKPCLDCSLQYVNAYIDSPKGRIVSSWSKTDNGVSVKITVPENSTAKIILEYKGKKTETVAHSGEYEFELV